MESTEPAEDAYVGMKAVDVLKAREKFLATISPDPYAYTSHLQQTAPQHELAAPGARLPANVRPSLIQRKLAAGQHTLAAALAAAPAPDATSSRDLRLDEQGLLEPESTNVAQFGFSLERATFVGPSGLHKLRPTLRSVARLALFDRQGNRFLGPAHCMPATSTSGKDSSVWVWEPAGCAGQAPLGAQPRGAGPAAQAGGALGAAIAGNVGGMGGANACIVRVGAAQADPALCSRTTALDRVMLYVELNVAFPLAAEDAEAVPESEHKARRLVDELTLCWAMISVARCAELTREMEISVPLYTGSLYDPQPLRLLWASEAKKHPVRAFFNGPKTPHLTFCAGPLPAKPPPLLPYSLMPANLVAHRDAATALAAYRILLAVQLAVHSSAAAPDGLQSAASGGGGGGGGGVPGGLAASAPGAGGGGRGGRPGGRDGGGGGWPSIAAATAAVAAATDGRRPRWGVGDVAMGDPALAACQRLLRDEALAWALVSKWGAWCREALTVPSCLSTCGDISSSPAQPTLDHLLCAFKRCVLEVAPLARCSSLPPPSISNFAEYNQHRRKLVAEWFYEVQGQPPGGGAGRLGAARDPVEPLSRSAKAYLHEPFDVSETRVCLGDAWRRSGSWRSC